MNSKGRLVHGRPVTGGSFPAAIWKKFMQLATDGMDDRFTEPTPEQIRVGKVLNERDLQTPDEQPQIPAVAGRHHDATPSPATPTAPGPPAGPDDQTDGNTTTMDGGPQPTITRPPIPTTRPPGPGGRGGAGGDRAHRRTRGARDGRRRFGPLTELCPRFARFARSRPTGWWG